MHNIFHIGDWDAPRASIPHSPSSAPTAHQSDERRQLQRRLPVPDVIEGNGSDTDWALWTQWVEEQQQSGHA